MCFSAGASFTAGVLLTFIGAETLRKVHKPSQLAFAAIPVFFALQQFTEGGLWLTIGIPQYARHEGIFTLVFLGMAQIIWPILIPVAVLLLEEKRRRKKILAGLLLVGMGIGFVYAHRLAVHPVHAAILGRHIVYQDTSPSFSEVLTITLYLGATIAPLFVSSQRRVYLLGAIMGLSFIVAALFYIRCLTSVWCFFAAVISFVVYYLVRDTHRKFHLTVPCPHR
jgi:hypothetical protein